MKKKILLVMVASVLAFSVTTIRAQVSYTMALESLTNIAKVTAANAATFPTDMTNVTTATMYGAALYTITPAATYRQSLSTFGRTSWVIALSNLGNAQAPFKVGVYATNRWYGGGSWNTYISNATPTINPGEVAFTTLVISNVTPASNNAFVSVLVYASNLQAPQAYYAYLGYDATGAQTVRYGGTLGQDTNGGSYASTRGPISFLQFAAQAGAGFTNAAGFLTAQLAGPVLHISKTIVSILHPAAATGLTVADGTVEPGSIITYQIWVSNSGSKATAAKIADQFNATYFDLVDWTNGSIFTNGAGATAGRMVFVATNGVDDELPAATADKVKIRVRVK